jgi:rare lipoprotein A (peptidoglycan hydrolase)
MKQIQIFAFLIIMGCASNVSYETKTTQPQSKSKEVRQIEQHGKIYYYHTSFYGKEFHGRQTASGEKYNMYDYTCAHKEFPFGTKLKVTNEDNGHSVVVRVNDRGPFVEGRDLDLSYAAARKIGLVPYGVKEMKVQVIK